MINVIFWLAFGYVSLSIYLGMKDVRKGRKYD